ncbi:MAG: trypsin-like peptidase domain-containing protein [Gemmatimonadota bacterium]|nr:trypsin-like peptidase domain-containing protein [Gemmatimonadota bacterium]
MTLELRVLSGSRAGVSATFDDALVSVGRHAMSDLRFDPEGDLDVSAKHAEFRESTGAWSVADQGSTNGTFVNGERIASERRLANGDIVSFGANGPRVEVHGIARSANSAAAAGALGVSSRPAGQDVSPRIDTSERVAHRVAAETQSMRRMFAVSVGALIVIAAGVLVWQQRQSAAQLAELTVLAARSDSATAELKNTIAAMRPADSALKTRLQQELAQREADRAQAQLAIASGKATRGSVEQLSRPLPVEAQIDYRRITAANDGAVAMIVSDLDGTSIAGTAFSVNATGAMVTNRHVVRTDAGHPPARIAVLFANTTNWMPAHVVRLSSTDDLALIQLDVPGTRPVVNGVSRLGAGAQVGAAVASIGYPLANDTPMEGDGGLKITARTTLTPGTVSKRLDDVIQIDSYAGHGSSGSPLFDASANVVGVIYGGAAESNGRIVYAVPAQRLAAFLAADMGGVLR